MRPSHAGPSHHSYKNIPDIVVRRRYVHEIVADHLDSDFERFLVHFVRFHALSHRVNSQRYSTGEGTSSGR